jgi:hypothetical protein
MLVQANPASCTRANGRSVVLLARIVDRVGRPVRPSDIGAIEYSIGEFDPQRSIASSLKGAQSTSRLATVDVILQAVVRDSLWKVDNVGYNFRHDIRFDKRIGTPQFSGHMIVRYVFTQSDCARMAVRFHLKLI